MKYLNYFHLNPIIQLFLLYLFNLAEISCELNLTILHNNDFHSHYEPINEWNSDCKGNQTCFGGVARTVSKVKEILNELGEERVLFLNAGDHFQGTIWYAYEKWKVVAEFVKPMAHDVMALGNHEFDDGVDGLLPFLRNVTQNNVKDLPVIACNIETSGDLKELIKPSVVIKRGNTSIAIIGYITPDTKFLSRPGSTVKFNDEIESINKELTRLKGEHGDKLNIIIALGHSGFEKDKEIAEKIADLDIVVGGHTNTFLYTGKKPSNEEAEGPYPVVFDHGTKGKTLVVQAFAYGKYLGKLNVIFDNNGIITSYGGNPILLDHTVKEDPDVLSKVKEKALEIDERFNVNIGTSLVNLDSSKCREMECNTGNMFADAYVYYFVEQAIARKQDWTSSAISVVNGGDVRSGMSVGNITMKDIVSASPFGNHMGILKLNGSQLWEILEHSSSQHRMGGFLQVSGIRYRFDSTQPKGQRLKSVRVRCADCMTPIYEPLENNKTYALVISEYLANGGDDYTMIIKEDFISSPIFGYQIISTYIQKFSPIITGIEDRIINKQGEGGGEGGGEGEINNNNGQHSVSSTFILIFISLLMFLK